MSTKEVEQVEESGDSHVSPTAPVAAATTTEDGQEDGSSSDNLGVLSIVRRTFSRPENFVWNSNTPHAGAVTEESNPAGVWMNQGAGKRGNTIDFEIKFICHDKKFSEHIDERIRGGGDGLMITTTLLRVNKLTLKPVLTEDVVSLSSKRNSHGDLVGDAGKLIVRCNRGSQIKMVKRGDSYLAIISLRIETTSSKSDRSEFVLKFETDNPAISPCFSKPVFVVTKIRTPNHYRHDKTLAKLKDVLRRLESVSKMNPTKVLEIMNVAQSIVDTADAFERCSGERSLKKHQVNPRAQVSMENVMQSGPLTAKAKAAAASAAAAASMGAGNGVYGGNVIDLKGTPIVDDDGHLTGSAHDTASVVEQEEEVESTPADLCENESSQATDQTIASLAEKAPTDGTLPVQEPEVNDNDTSKTTGKDDNSDPTNAEVEEQDSEPKKTGKRKQGRIEDTAASVLQSLGASVVRTNTKRTKTKDDVEGI